MKLIEKEKLPLLPKMELAVVGHVEWVTFLKVDKFIRPGLISHAKDCLEEPAGGGAVIAVKLAQLTNQKVHLFTALGKDELGRKSADRLEDLGIKLSIAWKDEPTRRGISIIDPLGERSITVIGKRIEPRMEDGLPWNDISNYDGVFLTAGDHKTINHCRKCKFIAATPRLGIEKIKKAQVKLDVLIGSGLDPDEKVEEGALSIDPKYKIITKGSLGGEVFPGGKFKAHKLKGGIVDTYGCGDSFAAGVTAGLSAEWNIEESINLGAYLGGRCANLFGPY